MCWDVRQAGRLMVVAVWLCVLFALPARGAGGLVWLALADLHAAPQQAHPMHQQQLRLLVQRSSFCSHRLHRPDPLMQQLLGPLLLRLCWLW